MTTIILLCVSRWIFRWLSRAISLVKTMAIASICCPFSTIDAKTTLPEAHAQADEDGKEDAEPRGLEGGQEREQATDHIPSFCQRGKNCQSKKVVPLSGPTGEKKPRPSSLGRRIQRLNISGDGSRRGNLHGDRASGLVTFRIKRKAI